MTEDMPLKVVLDTNIVVSVALSSDGNPARIFEMLLYGKIKNYTSKEILEEIKQVMEREKIRKIINFEDKEFIINTFERVSEKISPEKRYEIIKDDPKDNKFIECAVSASANYIISGDEHLLNLKEFNNIKIISPADFVNLVEETND